jgi:hypothetical protein
MRPIPAIMLLAALAVSACSPGGQSSRMSTKSGFTQEAPANPTAAQRNQGGGEGGNGGQGNSGNAGTGTSR